MVIFIVIPSIFCHYFINLWGGEDEAHAVGDGGIAAGDDGRGPGGRGCSCGTTGGRGCSCGTTGGRGCPCGTTGGRGCPCGTTGGELGPDDVQGYWDGEWKSAERNLLRCRLQRYLTNFLAKTILIHTHLYFTSQKPLPGRWSMKRIVGPFVFVAVALLVMSGCATTLSPAAARIKESAKETVSGCKYLGEVTGTSAVGSNASILYHTGEDRAKSEALENAAKLGGTHIVWRSYIETVPAIATCDVYSCP